MAWAPSTMSVAISSVDVGEAKVLEFRARVLRLYLMVATVACLGVIPTYYAIGIQLLTIVCVVFAFVTIMATVGFQYRWLSLSAASRIFVAAIIIVCASGLYLGDETIDNKPWQLVIPIAVFTLLNAREARLWIAASMLTASLVLLARGPAYELLSSVVLLSAYATVVVAMDVFNRMNEQNIRTIARLSHTDPLTGLYNRQLLVELATNEFNRARRAGEPLCVYMIDIDHFKKFNDHYGHGAGDKGLIKVAHAIRKSARRASDLVFRYGGEEFCVVSSGLSAEASRALAESITDGVREMAIPHAVTNVGVLTVSAGFAHYDDLSGQTLETMLSRADAALYEAKARGRARVVESSEELMRSVVSRRAG